MRMKGMDYDFAYGKVVSIEMVFERLLDLYLLSPQCRSKKPHSDRDLGIESGRRKWENVRKSKYCIT